MPWEVIGLPKGNVAIVPLGDTMIHSPDQHCVCSPKWVPHFHSGSGVVRWDFTHRRMG